MIAKSGSPSECGHPQADPLEAIAHLIELRGATLGPSIHLAAAFPGEAARLRWPTLPAAALPASGRMAAGCGFNQDACRISALGEAIELLSTCAWGDEPLVLASEASLGAEAIGLSALNGLTPAQIASRDAWNARWELLDWHPSASDPQAPGTWIAAQETGSGRLRWVPAEYVLIGLKERGDESAGAVADSNGCAAGPTPAEARLAALLELVERDAAARWWYGARTRPGIAPETIGLPGDLLDHLRGRPRRTRLYDITTDLAVPVVAAASFAPDGTAVALGFAARPAMAAAARAAVCEMLAVETTLPPWRSGDFDAPLRTWLSSARLGTAPLEETPEHATDLSERPPDAEAALQMVLAAADRCGCTVCFVDLTRPQIGVPVFRAVSPDLCPLRPRFARARLLALDQRDMQSRGSARRVPNPIHIPP